MAAPNADLIDAAANHTIVCHHLRIRFLHLGFSLQNPKVRTLLTKSYPGELLDAILKLSVSMYVKFRHAGQGFDALNGVTSERKWLKAYKDAKWMFDLAVVMLRMFEGEATNLAVEWEAAGLRPMKSVAVGELYPGLEDWESEELDKELGLHLSSYVHSGDSIVIALGNDALPSNHAAEFKRTKALIKEGLEERKITGITWSMNYIKNNPPLNLDPHSFIVQGG
ncbi:hypothetical protein C8A00DRAFT_37394 [Chaetomidium leptoderma]|uniref:Uncharacterized protein n=1 Tax=Chaetomidium leptoderma TaxID=669021 RepID=A0AAN6VH35_9PEZI|nr:hypothetical protein C8A00DRAFT_37394 [Chaetomidium leptoderma]